MESNFGKYLKEKRQERNLTQKQLADELFVSESAVSKWERGVAHPDISLLLKLSELLGITEHELLTASTDTQLRKEKIQAKRWRALTSFWSLFFYISYGVALLTCFICNLAVNKTLSWFWIVLSAILLAFSITNLHAFIKKFRLVLVPLSIFLSLTLLLGVCAIYTGGKWFWIATLSTLFGLIIIFSPIFIANLPVFNKIKKFNNFISVGIDYLFLNFLLIVINAHTDGNWYLSLALPLTTVFYLVINLFLCVRFLRINKLLKTSVILFLVELFLTLSPILIKLNNPEVQKEIDGFNVFKANFSCWLSEVSLENNIALIVALTVLATAIGFLIAGIFKKIKNKY
ncbi:MAG: helix-turn-helix transcriptional regulator [Clostridia bacterium]|nr:helix-turn-helix transcriptional regulator [Clostridia bacterium]